MMEEAGCGQTAQHSSDRGLFQALFLFGSQTAGILPPLGIDTTTRRRRKKSLRKPEDYGLQECDMFENDTAKSNSSLMKQKEKTTLITTLREENEQQVNTKENQLKSKPLTASTPEGVDYALQVFERILQGIPKSGRQSVRAFRKMQEKYHHLFLYPQGKVGTLPEVDVGTKVKWRVQLKILGLHRPIERGIDWKEVDMYGHKELVALSVVSSNEYEDDIDNGETLIFTGEGGRDKKTKHQIENQSLGGGNEALYNSYFRQNSIRVIRRRYDAQGLKKFYTYDGLYQVQHKEEVIGISGKMIWKFRLVRERNQKPLEWSPRVPKTIKQRGKRANAIVRMASHENFGKEAHWEDVGDIGERGEQIIPKREEKFEEDDWWVEDKDSLTDTMEEDEMGSSGLEGEEVDSHNSYKEEMGDFSIIGKTNQSRDFGKGKKLWTLGEATHMEGVDASMINEFKHYSMGERIFSGEGSIQGGNLAKHNASNVFGKARPVVGTCQEKMFNDTCTGEIVRVAKHQGGLNGELQGGHQILSKHYEENLMFSEDEESDIESISDSEDDTDEEFEVEAILNHRTRYIDGLRCMEYLVQWKGYDESENSWEPEENMENAPIIVENYRKCVKLDRHLRVKK